jgi:hypothetical protein
MSNFLACRLCKGLSISIVNGISKCYAECDKCGAYGPDADSHADAMHAWNTLANDSARKIAETLASANELFDLARMKKALSGESYQVPSGITREQFKELIASHAPPDTPVPAVHAQEPVAWQSQQKDTGKWLDPITVPYSDSWRQTYRVRPLYTAPPDAQAIRDQANEMRIVLLVQLHNLVDMAERYSNRIEFLDPDESRYAAGAAKHALRLSAQYNYNGPIRAMIGKPTGEAK